jgi:hypothetical protein
MKENKQMEKISGLSISESEYDLEKGGKGKIAVFIYTGSADPKKVLDFAVHQYVQNEGYHELIDANLDNPWMRVILSDINGINQRQFDPNTDRLKPSSSKL